MTFVRVQAAQLQEYIHRSSPTRQGGPCTQPKKVQSFSDHHREPRATERKGEGRSNQLSTNHSHVQAKIKSPEGRMPLEVLPALGSQLLLALCRRRRRQRREAQPPAAPAPAAEVDTRHPSALQAQRPCTERWWEVLQGRRAWIVHCCRLQRGIRHVPRLVSGSPERADPRYVVDTMQSSLLGPQTGGCACSGVLAELDDTIKLRITSSLYRRRAQINRLADINPPPPPQAPRSRATPSRTSPSSPPASQPRPRPSTTPPWPTTTTSSSTASP